LSHESCARYLSGVVEKPVASTRGDTPVAISELDLETLKSEHAQRIDDDIDAYATRTTWRGYVLYAIAAVFAILLGVLPALWINRWRGGDATAAPASVEAERGSVTIEPIPPPTSEEVQTPAIDDTPSKTVPREPEEEAPVATAPAQTAEPTKRSRTRSERGKRPVSRPTKRPREKCDVYLHPHGCPR